LASAGTKRLISEKHRGVWKWKREAGVGGGEKKQEVEKNPNQSSTWLLKFEGWIRGGVQEAGVH